jgi:hypothetical protein
MTEPNSLVIALKDEITRVDDHYTIRPAMLEDVEQIFDLVNRAYLVENGDSGVAFKVIGAPRYRKQAEVWHLCIAFSEQ